MLLCRQWKSSLTNLNAESHWATFCFYRQFVFAVYLQSGRPKYMMNVGKNSSYITLPLSLAFFTFLSFSWNIRFPLSTFGLTLNNWKESHLWRHLLSRFLLPSSFWPWKGHSFHKTCPLHGKATDWKDLLPWMPIRSKCGHFLFNTF